MRLRRIRESTGQRRIGTDGHPGRGVTGFAPVRRFAISGLVGLLLLLTSGSTSFASTAKARWGSPLKAALPAKAVVGGLESVSCTSTGNCSAVGSYYSGASGQQGLLLTETAGTWGTGVELALPGDAHADPSTVLDQIACSSAGNCTAIGTYNDSTKAVMVTEADGSWGAGVAPALPANAHVPNASALSSVSCTTDGTCVAVGAYEDNAQNSQPVIWTETAGPWGTGVEVSLPADAATGEQSAELDSVSCPSPGNCSAFGSYIDGSGGDELLLMTETAGSWAPPVEAQLPANAATPHSYANLLAISCASAGNCSAVGGYCAIGKCGKFNNKASGGAGNRGLAFTETAGQWGRGVEVRLPADALATGPMQYIDSISCTAPGDCTAAGAYNAWNHGRDGTRLVLLTEIEGKWSKGVAPTLPTNADAHQETLPITTVSCVAPGDCAVSGSYWQHAAKSDLLQGLLLFQKDGVWATGAEAALPADAVAKFQEAWVTVSCTALTHCAAVGSYTGKKDGLEGLLTAGALRATQMPNLTGMTLRAARQAIASHGCSLHAIRHASSAKVRRGRVISQTPRPGTRLTLHTKISLVVSTGLP